MAQRYVPPVLTAATCTLADIAAIRRQLNQIELNCKKTTDGNIQLDEIKKQCDIMQNESKEMLSVTAQKQLHAHENLLYVTKRTKEINEVMEALNNAESVDACFLMDCTNSMRKYVDEVKERIFETVSLLKLRFPHLNIRLAFVGYRDLNLPEDKQYSILDFTDEKEFHAFVSTVKCAYGGDYCEDVLGGLQKTIELNWKQSVRILMHVGDSPSHGQRYHDLPDECDYYLTHDKDGSIGYSCIQELIELKVKYFFGRLTSHTDKMIEQFRTYTDKRTTIEEIAVKDFKNLLPFVVESISRSISETTSSLMKHYSVNNGDFRSVKCHRDIIFEDKEPIWSNMKIKKAKVIKYECNDQLSCEEVPQLWNIKIAENPFAEGGMRLAYYGLTQYKDTWEKTVFKEYKSIGHGANSKDKYLHLLDCQTVADYLAKEFNKLPLLTKQTAIVKKIKFIMTKLVFVPLDAGKYRNLTMERFIEGTYKKFSNNAGFVDYDDPSLTLQAFSHWTYERTNGDMMVVDLQGIIIGDNDIYLLTDPCIHATELKRFGGGNLGKQGMTRFFQTHVCNIICHALKLKPDKHQPDIKNAKYDSYFVNNVNRTVS